MQFHTAEGNIIKPLLTTLSGYIVSLYWNMSFLRIINLNQNDFRGSIPNEIGRLFRLQSLLLASNSFQGEFPANLSQCTDIRHIGMFHNNLQGKLPTEFAYWSISLMALILEKIILLDQFHLQ